MVLPSTIYFCLGESPGLHLEMSVDCVVLRIDPESVSSKARALTPLLFFLVPEIKISYIFISTLILECVCWGVVVAILNAQRTDLLTSHIFYAYINCSMQKAILKNTVFATFKLIDG